MRIIDVACATSFALTSMLILVAVNPGATTLQAHEVAARSTAEDLIQGYLSHHGLQFLATSDYDSICSTAKSFSNSTASVSISVDGRRCPGLPPPPRPISVASVTLDLRGRIVVVEAWNIEGKG